MSLGNNSLLFSLPNHIQVSIAIQVGKNIGTDLGPLIASGPQGKDLALTPVVLKEASFDHVAVIPTIINVGKPMYKFLHCCVEAGNPTASYLASLRLAVQDGDIDQALFYLHEKESNDPKFNFAYALILSADGQHARATIFMNKLKRLVSSYDGAVNVIKRVYQDISMLGPRSKVCFISTWQNNRLNPISNKINCKRCSSGVSCPRCCQWWQCPLWPTHMTYNPERPHECEFHIGDDVCGRFVKWWNSGKP